MSTFVAREAELARLADLLERALRGRSSIAFITGEAGSGKSALLSEFVARTRAQREDLAVAVGVCNAQTGVGDPYLPFREVLADLTLGRDGGAAESVGEATQLARFLRASARALVEHAPDLVDILVPGGAILTRLGSRAVERFEWARRLSEITRGRSAGGSAASSLDRDHIFQQYTALLRAVAREHPLVLILDDLHWADPASAALMFHLARRLDEDRVLILGAYRPVDVALGRRGERHPLEPVVNELQRYHGDLFVRLGDEPAEGRRFVDALVAARAPGLDESFRGYLFAHTGGHPLFTVELLRHLQETGGIARGEDGMWRRGRSVDWSALPARVEGLIAERAGRLEPSLLELLTIAAVEGQDFSAEVVAEVAGRDAGAVIRSLSGELQRRHRLVEARGVERVNGRRVAGYSFRHSLFQSYFYGAIDDVERAYLHEQVGEALERLYGDRRDRIAIRLARHYLEAGRPAAALPYLLLAGDQACDACANEDAAERYDHAEALVERAGAELGEAELGRLSARVWEGRGDLAERAGQHERAIEHYRVAAELLATHGVDDPLLKARLARRSAKPLENLRRHPEAADRLMEAERLLGAEPPAGASSEREWWREWIQIRIARVWVAYWRGQVDVMREALESAWPAIEERATPVQRGGFHYCRGLRGMREERYAISDDTIDACRTAFELTRQGGHLAEVGLVEFGLGFCHLWRHELEDAERVLRMSMETARSAGDRTLEARCLVYLSVTARLRADVGAAEDWADLAEEAARDAGLDEYLGTVHAQRAWIAWRRRDPTAAEAEAHAALALWDELPYRYPLRILGVLPLMAVRIEQGDIATATALAATTLPPPMARLPSEVEAAIVAAVERHETGDEAAAGAALRKAVEAAVASGFL